MPEIEDAMQRNVDKDPSTERRSRPEPRHLDRYSMGIGAALARQYGARNALSRRSGGVVVASVSADLPDWTPLQAMAIEEGLQITVDLRPGGWRRTAGGASCDTQHPARANGVALSSLACPSPAWARGSFDILSLILDREALDQFATVGVDQRLADPGGVGSTVDVVVGGIASTLACALHEPEATTRPYFPALVGALIGRVLSAPGGPPAISRPGGLAPWQERCAKELLLTRLAIGVSVEEIARECRLSRSHFCKAFKVTTGHSPYAWLTQRRIATAQSLMRTTSQSLADIALACGFVDQSHLTRMFSRTVGTSPGVWRRALSG